MDLDIDGVVQLCTALHRFRFSRRLASGEEDPVSSESHLLCVPPTSVLWIIKSDSLMSWRTEERIRTLGVLFRHRASAIKTSSTSRDSVLPTSTVMLLDRIDGLTRPLRRLFGSILRRQAVSGSPQCVLISRLEGNLHLHILRSD